MSKFIPYDMTTTDEIADPEYEGKVRARCIGSTLATASTGTECVRLVFQALSEQPPGCVAELADEIMVTDRYLTDNAAPRTMQALRLCGWKTDDMADLYYDESGTPQDDAERFARSGLGENEVELVLKAEEFNNTTRVRVAFVNGIPTPVKRSHLQSMTERLGSLISASRNGGPAKGSQPNQGLTNPSAQQSTQGQPPLANFRQGGYNASTLGTSESLPKGYGGGAKVLGADDANQPRVNYGKNAPSATAQIEGGTDEDIPF